MPWEAIVGVSLWLIFKNYHMVLPNSEVNEISRPGFIGRTTLKTESLLELLRGIRYQSTTDPKDRVFSILGLAAEAIESKDPRQVVPTRMFHGYWDIMILTRSFIDCYRITPSQRFRFIAI